VNPDHRLHLDDARRQAELIGRGLHSRGSVSRQMRLPGLDVIFGLAAPTVGILVKDTGVAGLQIRDDEARVGPFHADFDACDDPLGAAPALQTGDGGL
jgi:hypothetical protein